MYEHFLFYPQTFSVVEINHIGVLIHQLTDIWAVSACGLLCYNATVNTSV